MIVISRDLVLSAGADINGDNPVVGYDNIVTAGAVSADSESADYPATNLANPSTYLRWVGETASPPVDEYLTVTITREDPVDYVAIARHNFGTAQIAISIEGSNGDSPEWFELIPDVLLPDDGPVLFRFTSQQLQAVRVRLQPGAEAPTAAVLYVGKLLVLQRRIYVGHTPMPYGRSTQIQNGRSEAGHFLGRVVLQETRDTAVTLQNLTATWYRTYMDPFIRASQELPFFFAWRPQSYPYETGYGWMTNSPRPVNQRVNGMMQIDLQMSGVV
jgi:hypothetical protein